MITGVSRDELELEAIIEDLRNGMMTRGSLKHQHDVAVDNHRGLDFYGLWEIKLLILSSE